jgi:TolA-binding protein
MNFFRRHTFAAIVCFATALAILPARAQAPAQPLPLDLQALERGKAAIDAQNYPEAIKALEELLKAYAQSPAVPEALFRLGYAYYLSGDYDRSVQNFLKVPAAKGAPAEIVELASSLAPQVLAAKAAKIDAKDPLRDKTLNDAIGQFDVFLQKFPQSDEAESANYGKALALFQLGKYDEAQKPLRLNLQKYPQSESIQDSQFTLALVLGMEAVTMLQKEAADPGATPRFDEGEKLLRDIVAKRLNVALVNDAQFQLGEMLSARAAFTPADRKEQREAIFQKALEAYRAVLGKDQVIAAQKQRIELLKTRRIDTLKQGNFPLVKRLERLQGREQEKLASFEGRGDDTVTVKLKSGQIFFQLGKFDEARVLLAFLEPQVETPDVKKEVAYYITMTYALQGLMEKAEARYKDFQSAYKGDPIAQNLQLVMAAGFVGSKDAKLQQPEKAIAYCQEGLAIYPQGRFVADLLNVQASALIGLRRFDEALALLQKFIASNPPKELAADAEFNLAIIYKDTGRLEDSLKAFRAMREKFPGTRQAETASFWLGQLGIGADPKAAVAELKDFVSKRPKSELLPQALFALGQAQVAISKSDDALATFQDLQKRFPQSEPATFTYFERAKIMVTRQAYDDCLKIMREFVAQYPDSPALYQAYDYMAQVLGSQQKGAEAIGIYDEFLAKRPNDPGAPEALLKMSSLWKGYADAQGPVLAQDEKKRAEWTKGVENSIAAAEKILEKYPESSTVALALNNLLDMQKTRLRAHLTSEADIETYFNGLATKAEGQPAAQSKIRFTLASFVFQKDKPKAIKMLGDAYKPELKYAPEDMDLYGKALIEAKDFDKAIEVYRKLAQDYPLATPGKGPRQTQEAQAIALAGEGNALLGKKDTQTAAARFKELETHYAWSPKMMEVNYGLARDLHARKQDDEALKRLLDVVKNASASSALRANAMLLLGNIHEEAGRFDAAIDNYIKIGTFYSGVPEAAAEGLWRGAQLLERQARGEIPRPTPPPKSSPAPQKKG